jgi:molybdate transport system substrate-binding protein
VTGRPGVLGANQMKSGSAIRRYAALALAGALVIFAASLLWRQGTSAPSGATSLTLFCGAGMRPAMEEIIVAYHQRSPVRVQATYGASNLLLGQLKLREDLADLFLPGDAFYVEQARDAALVEQQEPVGWFVPAIMVRPGNPLGISSLADLALPGTRLALGEERSAAIGRLMPQLLQRSGLPKDALEPNLVFAGATVHELAGAVSLGHVDAAVVWESVARLHQPCEVVAIDAGLNVPSPLAIGLVSGSGQKRAARDFMSFLQSQEAREILRAHHYEVDQPMGARRSED